MVCTSLAEMTGSPASGDVEIRGRRDGRRLAGNVDFVAERGGEGSPTLILPSPRPVLMT